MENREITIKVQNDRIWLNPRISIPIQQTNIPIEHMTFRSHEPIFWKVEMLYYNAGKNSLMVLVKEYYASDITNFDKQEPRYAVEKLLFEKLDWRQLEPLLSIYQKIHLTDFLINADSDSFTSDESPTRINIKPVPVLADIQPYTGIQQIGPKPTIRIISKDIWVGFDEAHFILGYVAFKMHINNIGKEIDFQIPNVHILAEFDNIKFWFAKKLKTKKFKVHVSITVTNNEVTETKATSKQIDQITPELIDSVRCQRTIALSKELRINNPEKSLFSVTEIFTMISSEDIEGNVFNQTEEDILEVFLEHNKVRNKKQLEYLAGNMQSENHKLRYTSNPNFGFLFLIEGTKNNHFVWELLNSNGTYIWSIEKNKQSVEEQYKRIEDIINLVRTSGRENYKRTYKNMLQDNDLVFNVIYHEDIESKSVDAFPKWKSKLEEHLK